MQLAVLLLLCCMVLLLPRIYVVSPGVAYYTKGLHFAVLLLCALNTVAVWHIAHMLCLATCIHQCASLPILVLQPCKACSQK
jgi:hypothetical protein